MATAFATATRDPEAELELHELLGEGAYGAVYRAHCASNGREVAVKIIPAADDAADSLRKEIGIMLKCSSPYLVQLYDSFFKDHEAWLVMDYCGGGSASDVIEACQVTFTEGEIREAIAWSLLGLQYLHGSKKLHRDVKAANILLTDDGRAKLADFGVSKEVSSVGGNKANTVIGTPFWMSPEVIQEVPYDGRADVWSLGITAIELAEGDPPLSKVHPMRAIFMIPSKPPPKLKEPDKWSAEFIDFVAKALVKKPEDRATCQELLKHPWVKADVERITARKGTEGTPHLKALVTRHAPTLDAFRKAASAAKAARRAAARTGSSNNNTGGSSSSAAGTGSLAQDPDEDGSGAKATMRVMVGGSGGGGSGSSRRQQQQQHGSMDSTGSVQVLREKMQKLESGDSSGRRRSSGGGSSYNGSSHGSCSDDDDEGSTGSCVRLNHGDSDSDSSSNSSSDCEADVASAATPTARTPTASAAAAAAGAGSDQRTSSLSPMPAGAVRRASVRGGCLNTAAVDANGTSSSSSSAARGATAGTSNSNSAAAAAETAATASPKLPPAPDSTPLRVEPSKKSTTTASLAAAARYFSSPVGSPSAAAGAAAATVTASPTAAAAAAAEPVAVRAARAQLSALERQYAADAEALRQAYEGRLAAARAEVAQAVQASAAVAR